MADSTEEKNTMSRTIRRSTADLSSDKLKKRLQQMNEYRFEYLVADLWEEWGWQTIVTQRSNDGGVDVVAESRVPSPQKWLIQAKCYSSSLSAPELREYAGLLLRNDDADRVVVVSTAGFTRPARKDSENYDRLQLIGGDTLVGEIDKRDSYGILDGYDDLQPEPVVETIPDPESEPMTTTAGDIIPENKKSIQIHDLSEKEVAKRVDRIDSEGVHPSLSLLRRKFPFSDSERSASESQGPSSVWKQTSLAKTEGDKTIYHRYANRAFGGGCAICDTFTSLRVVSGEVPARKVECIKCSSRFLNKNAGNGYKDKAEWELIWGGNGRLGEENPLKALSS